MHNTFDSILEIQKKSPAAFEEFQAIIKTDTGKKGDKLVTFNSVCRNVYIPHSGVVRHFRQNEEGKEYNSWFSFEGQVVVAMESFIFEKPSEEGIELMEDCEYSYFSRFDLNKLTEKYHSIETLYRKLLELYYIEVEERSYRLLSQSAAQKYNFLLHNKPHFIQRIPQVHLASFLGITKETLSRIKSKYSQ